MKRLTWITGRLNVGPKENLPIGENDPVAGEQMRLLHQTTKTRIPKKNKDEVTETAFLQRHHIRVASKEQFLKTGRMN